MPPIWARPANRSIDDLRSARLLTPRNPASNCSARNKARVEQLTAAGRMHAAGLAAVAAKAYGAWTALDETETLAEPALTFSLIAILISVVSSRWQSADVRRSNLMLYITELGQRSRTQGFREALNYINTQLSEFDPALGVYGLPEPACGHVLLVGGFYQDLGLLVVTGVMDERLAAAIYYTGIKDAWRALEPYIRGERTARNTRGGGNFFGSFENLAVYVASVPHEDVRRRFIRRSFSAPATDSADTAGEAIDSV